MQISKSRDVDTLLIVVEENMSDRVYSVNVKLNHTVWIVYLVLRFWVGHN